MQKALEFYADMGFEVVISKCCLKATHLPTGKVVYLCRAVDACTEYNLGLMLNSMNASYLSLQRKAK